MKVTLEVQGSLSLKELKTIFEDKLNQLPPKQLKFSRLLRNNVVLNQNYSLLRQKLEEAKINIFSQFGKVQIVDYASVPEKSADNHTRTILLGIFLGIGISFGLIMLIEVIDNTVKTNHDIENNNFRPIENSVLVDGGLLNENLNINYEGEYPDIGAYEFGGEYWIPGITWDLNQEFVFYTSKIYCIIT